MSEQSMFLVSGERSGDLHAAELLHALERELIKAGKRGSFEGLGGPELKKKYGEGFEDWVEEAAVIGITEVLKKYGYFKRKFAEVLERILRIEPDAVILVDYPGFNLRLAKALRAKGYKGKVCYYVSPQVWAWNKGRIPKMAETLDLMMCVFEFEKALYEESGLLTEWVGHPMVEELEERRDEGIQREAHLIGLFPGSRSREVRSLLPTMLEAAYKVHQQYPEYRFELAVASERVLELCHEMLHQSPLYYTGALKYEVGQSYRLMQSATAAWVASGTATLESGFYGMPYCLVYRVSSLTYWIAKALVRIPFIGMVNILAKTQVVREFIQEEVTAENLSDEMERMLRDGQYRSTMIESLERVKDQLGGGGAHEKAAQAIVKALS